MVVRIPENVFLDTSVVNFILDHEEEIHDGAPIRQDASPWVRRDIVALAGIWLTGQRASWRLTISPSTIAEIQDTRNAQRLQVLLGWASELWTYSEECASGSEQREKILFGPTLMTALALLPDPADRQLVREAIAAGCDAFCTRDWRTILRHRESLRSVPLSFLSPHEWWQGISPYAALFA
jgi:hypothetical protein